MSFDENENDSVGAAVEIDEDGRPQFSEINKNSGFLDKVLAASGFTRKDQDELEKVQSNGSIATKIVNLNFLDIAFFH